MRGDTMSRRRTGMKKIRDIMRLKETTDMSERQIARALNVARTVVARYLSNFYKVHIKGAFFCSSSIFPYREYL